MLSTDLVCDYGTARSTRICGNDYAAVEETAYNRCSCAGRLWQRHTLGVEGRIAVVVGEVEAAHRGGVCLVVCVRGSGDGGELVRRCFELVKAGEVVETVAAMEVA